MSDPKSTTRFGNRVEDYVKYRPNYPAEIVTYLENKFGLSPGNLIADIGSGTGISSSIFLDRGYSVVGIEPNSEMRNKSKTLLGSNPKFTAKDGTAEHSGLETHSVDAIVAGQAFHWFDQRRANQEFSRILKPNGLVILIWNERLIRSGFEKDYDELIIKHARDYVQVDHRNVDLEKITAFFSPQPVTVKEFDNQQIFDFEGLEGRLLSSSYMPAKTEVGYQEMSDDLKLLFDQYQENGLIVIHYKTKTFAGRWKV